MALLSMLSASAICGVGSNRAAGQQSPPDSAEHEHQHGEKKEPVKRPRVFLDKSPRIVWYQLNRLDNERLLLVER
ncbi:MAG: hypothetical protein QGG36_17510, partial [Pirellulaceae bacterium]|nr:hypothetical protein [Pirellulaceae bacterium]